MGGSACGILEKNVTLMTVSKRNVKATIPPMGGGVQGGGGGGNCRVIVPSLSRSYKPSKPAPDHIVLNQNQKVFVLID